VEDSYGKWKQEYLAMVLKYVHKVMENHGASGGFEDGVKVFIAV
jgi:hypothetical protein